jgi:hypothetical protein
MLSVVVHTTGVNWDGVLANVASITVILGVFAAVVARNIKRAIKDEIRSVISSDVTPALEKINTQIQKHDTRIARLEGVEEGKKQAIAQAGVST